MTDYANMDMYFFDELVLRKFIRFCLEGFPLDAAKLMITLQPVLAKLFFVRLTNWLLDLRLTALSFDRCCSIKHRGIAFDLVDYIKRYLHKNGRAAEFESFFKVVNEYRKKGEAVEPRIKMHGHDFTELLAWLIKALTPKADIQGSAAVGKILRTCVEIRWLRQQGLFAELCARCGVR